MRPKQTKIMMILLSISLSTALMAGWECIVTSEISASSARQHLQINAINKAFMECDMNTTRYFECTLTSCMKIN